MRTGNWYYIYTIYGEKHLVHVRKVERKFITVFYHYNGKPVVAKLDRSDILSLEKVI